MIEQGAVLWTPSPERAASSHMSKFMKWVENRRGLDFAGDYEQLRRWSVERLEEFWGDCWDYFGLECASPNRQVLSPGDSPGRAWFAGSAVNFAQQLLRPGAEDEPALIHLSEFRPAAEMSRGALRSKVRILATQLRGLGIRPGDRVVSYMPNIAETVIAFLATSALGAIWSSAAPEFGVQTVLDRFGQIEPKLIFAADGYMFNGKPFDRRREVREIVDALSSLEHIVWLPYLDAGARPPRADAVPWGELEDGTDPGAAFEFAAVPHDHPLWIVFSSGTTGLPKPIVHSHIGALLEGLVAIHLHADMGPGDRMFFYATSGWIMWNLTVVSLAGGAAAVLYDGHPCWPEADSLWRMADEQKVTLFGASPSYVQILDKAGIRPRDQYELDSLRAVMLSGSPATPEVFAWFHRAVKDDLWVQSVSGGTDIAGVFVGGCPLLPVRAGEIQCRLLGHDVQAWSADARPTIGEIGEMVCAQPIPSMPIRFWNDPGNERYRATYFEHFPGVWRHGDFLQIMPHGGCYIHGRSDSTLNRHGVRIGTAEIYRAIEQIEEVSDSLIVCCDLDGGTFFMPLFVTLRDDHPLDDMLAARLRKTLRDQCSPRHVPDRIYRVEAIPYTLSGKRMEVPVRKILMGCLPEQAASRESMRDPTALDYFIRFAAECPDYTRPER